MKTAKALLNSTAVTLLILVALFILLVFSGYPEGYCYFWPNIDTKYAPGYSEQAFNSLKVGMTWEQVEKIMCPPLHVPTNFAGAVHISYTRDGNAPFGDFAWFGRGLVIRNGIVIGVDQILYMD